MANSKVDNEVFDLVHTMSSKGAKVKDICSCLGICEATVKRIRSANNLDEYKSKCSTYAASNNHKKRNGKVTDGKFKAIKAMLNTGISRQEVCNVSGLCKTTVRYIDQCESLDAYKKFISDRAKETYHRKNVKADIKPFELDTPARASFSDHRIYEALREQNELLKLISAKMAYIVEQLS